MHASIDDLNLTFAQKLRVARKIGLLYCWTMSMLWIRIFCTPLRHVAPGTERWIRRFIMRNWAAAAMRIAGVHVDTNGFPPDQQFYIVANHLSYLDIIIFARYLGCVFVAMKEMDTWPLVGFIIRNMDTIFVDRSSFRDAVRVNGCIEKTMQSKHSVMLFPESTTSTGEGVLPFRAALLKIPAQNKFPVHYASIRYEKTEACPDPANYVCWWDDTPFSVHAVRMLSLKRIDARVVFSDVPVENECRKTLANELESQVLQMLAGPPEPVEEAATV